MVDQDQPGANNTPAEGAPDPHPQTKPSRMSRRTKILIGAGAALVLILAAGGTAFALLNTGTSEPTTTAATKSPSPKPATTPTPTPTTPAGPKPVKVIAMGDMLPHDSVNANALQADGSYNYAPFFEGIKPELDAADLTFCNLEVPTAGVDFGISGYPTFNAPTEFARDLHGAAGCDLVNTATNHTADKGTAGIAATRNAWDALQPSFVSGANRSAEEQQVVPVVEKDGIRIALVSFAEYSNAPIDDVSLNLMSNDALVQQLMAKARETADVVIVSAHWGTEDSHEVNDQQRGFAQKVADLGADVIIGTGPHVLQPTTWLNRADGGKTLVWYSIGNMLNTQLTLDQRTGVIAGFELTKDGDTVQVTKPTAVLTYMHYDWTPAQEAANDLLARNNLSITPLAGADELLARTTFGVSAAQQVEASSAILGPDVTVLPK
ncbi:CapA family protein [Leucobacter viscericola]|uniref:CapA family protein n=1 Tax=Leucobacter viscericola TaxID=2714935 RepID=A0A6G7XEE7_9MICO|nr:CapA family protein [Leucobacter viscericola]QIK62748.1 CapA family protein [Leucobacter viscericola]